MKVIIDRFEGEFAVVELPDRSTAELPRVLVPGAKEGDVIHIEIDVEETQRRRHAAKLLADDMFK
jgi:hypothetical protein